MNTNASKREQLRKKREQQKRKKILIGLLIVAGIIALFAVIILLPKLLMKQPRFADSQGFTIGNPQAPVSVTQFSSFYCSHCKTFSEMIELDFINKYVKTGNVYYRYVIVTPNDPSAINAAEASYCAADQNRFFDYKDLLHTYSAATAGFSTDNLLKYASSIGMDKDKFERCLESDLYATAYLEDQELAQTSGVSATPMFLVNDQLVFSDQLFSTIETALNQ